MSEIETLRKLVEAGDKCSEFVLEDDCVFDNEDYAFAKLAINSRPILKALLERVERYEDESLSIEGRCYQIKSLAGKILENEFPNTSDVAFKSREIERIAQHIIKIVGS